MELAFEILYLKDNLLSTETPRNLNFLTKAIFWFDETVILALDCVERLGGGEFVTVSR